MEYLPRQISQEGLTTVHSVQNVVNPASQIFYMVPTQAPVTQEISCNQRCFYDISLSRRFVGIMITLSVIQLVMAVFAIITTGIGLQDSRPPDAHVAQMIGDHWIWHLVFAFCKLAYEWHMTSLLFGLSGMFGIISSLKPSFVMLINFMVCSIISSTLCVPFLIWIGYSYVASDCWEGGKCIGVEFTHTVLKIKVFICLIQAIAAIASSVVGCKSISGYRRKNTDSGAPYYHYGTYCCCQ